jgi:hypothetical protein
VDFFFFFFIETGFHYVAQVGLELMIFLPQPPRLILNVIKILSSVKLIGRNLGVTTYKYGLISVIPSIVSHLTKSLGHLGEPNLSDRATPILWSSCKVTEPN